MTDATAPKPVGGNRRALTLLAIGVGVVIVLFVAMKVFGGGGSHSASKPLPSSGAPAAIARPDGSAPGGAGFATPSVTGNGPAPNATRDPFQPAH